MTFDIADDQRVLVIRASAGTGKTYQLTNRLLKLMLDGVAPEQILATTFTRKAAGEILDRLMRRLALAATDKAELKALRDAIKTPGLSRQQLLTTLRQTTATLHRLRVGTLDSFFAKIAGGFSLELDLPPGWKMVEEIDEVDMRDSAIFQTLHDGDVGTLVSLLHLMTKGETTASVARVVRDTVQSVYALFQESDSSAWKRLKLRKPISNEELTLLLDELRELPVSGQVAKGRDKDYWQAFNDEWNAFIKDGIAKVVLAGKDTYCRTALPEETLRIYQRLLDHAQAMLVNQLRSQADGTRSLLNMYDTQLERVKTERRAYRFDDITRKIAAANVTAATDEHDPLAFRMDGSIRHLLLDEFQDTSASQWRVLLSLARRMTSRADSSFFCVGDVKQAIYSWRGGDADIFDRIGEQLSNVTEESMACSYRSSPIIIETVNQIFQNLTNHNKLGDAHAAVQRWQKAFPEHSVADANANLSGYACMHVGPVATEGQEQKDATMEFAASEVARLVQEAPGYTVGVLTRTNKTVGQLIYLLRNRHGVFASEEGGNPLTDSAAVDSILSLLRLADHPGDRISRFHVAKSPLGREIGYEDYGASQPTHELARRIRRAIAEDGYGSVVYRYAQHTGRSV